MRFGVTANALPMSALGQMRTWPYARSMSASPPKADMQGCCDRISRKCSKDYDGRVELFRRPVIQRLCLTTHTTLRSGED
jgi:hypothetical protein